MIGDDSSAPKILPFVTQNLPPQRMGVRRHRGVRVTGLDFTPASQTETLIPRETKEQLIAFHMSSINAIRKQRGADPLNASEFGRIQAAAQSNPGASSESIMLAVLGEAVKLDALSTQTFDKQIAQAGLEKEYHDFARSGMTFASFSAMLAALQGYNRARATGYGGSPSEWAQLTGNMSSAQASLSSYGGGLTPYYGGTVFTTSQQATKHMERYAITQSVGNQLYGIGVTSAGQVEKVVSDVGKLGLGTGTANPRFTNAVAVPVAKLRMAEGARTDQHLAFLQKNSKEAAQLKVQIEEAQKAGNTELATQLQSQLKSVDTQAEQYKDKEVKNENGKKSFVDVRDKAIEEATQQISPEQRAEFGAQAYKSVAQGDVKAATALAQENLKAIEDKSREQLALATTPEQRAAIEAKTQSETKAQQAVITAIDKLNKKVEEVAVVAIEKAQAAALQDDFDKLDAKAAVAGAPTPPQVKAQGTDKPDPAKSDADKGKVQVTEAVPKPEQKPADTAAPAAAQGASKQATAPPKMASPTMRT